MSPPEERKEERKKKRKKKTESGPTTLSCGDGIGTWLFRWLSVPNLGCKSIEDDDDHICLLAGCACKGENREPLMWFSFGPTFLRIVYTNCYSQLQFEECCTFYIVLNSEL